MFSDHQLLSIDLYAGVKDDAGVRLYQSKMVTTRKPHHCLFATHHIIPTGSRARVESGILDGKWRHWYACDDCLIKWLREEADL